jgi:chemotaxis signal transduction protein
MVQLLYFLIDGLQCALPLPDVESVIQMMQITPKEDGTRGLAGSINLHGRILPVYSLRELLGSPDRPPKLSDMLVIVRAGPGSVALWIDETRGVHDLPPIVSGSAGLVRNAPQLPGISITDTGILIADLPLFLASVPDTPLKRPIPGDGTPDRVNRTPAVPRKAPQSEDPRVLAVLSERARKMVQPEMESAVPQQAEILRFQLAYQEYAIGMDFVREVILTGEITPVPGTPDFISGICAARGQIISLVDLRALFRIPEKGLTDLNRVIVITDQKITFGILADTISGVGTIVLDHIAPPQKDDLPGGRRYLKGVGENHLFVLDAAAILNDPGIIVDDT